MIVEAFKEALEVGLEKPGQVVVRINTSIAPWNLLISASDSVFGADQALTFRVLANDTHFRIWLANGRGEGRLSGGGSWYVLLFAHLLIRYLRNA